MVVTVCGAVQRGTAQDRLPKLGAPAEDFSEPQFPRLLSGVIPHTKHFMFMTSLREGTIIRPIFEMRKLKPRGLW